MGQGIEALEDGKDITRYGVYAGVKDMITALSRTAAMEFGSGGIRFEESLARSPFGRYGDPEVDIGRAVAWLCSDDASYITGSMIMLDGGRYYLH
jgi:NAD(P)-dependent dehydrogenase (short-subunit alcohol dehydrogenase family)